MGEKVYRQTDATLSGQRSHHWSVAVGHETDEPRELRWSRTEQRRGGFVQKPTVALEGFNIRPVCMSKLLSKLSKNGLRFLNISRSAMA